MFYDAALVYVRLGWRVFPVEPNGKRPIQQADGHRLHWSSTATLSPKQIEIWSQLFPGANIGIVTGQPSGIFALDVDSKNGHDGEDSLFKLQTLNSPLPPTLVEWTPSGRHILFSYNSRVHCSVGTLGEGLDVRSDGGYIVATPSRVSDFQYSWDDARSPLEFSPVDAPDWLLNSLVDTKPTVDYRVNNLMEGDAHFWLERYLARAAHGKRNQVGFLLSCQLRDSGIPIETALTILEEYAHSVVQDTPYTVGEALASLRSAYSRPPRHAASRSERFR